MNRRTVPLLLAAMLLVAPLSACSQFSGSSSEDRGLSTVEVGPQTGSAPDGMAGDALDATAETGTDGSSDPAGAERSVVRTGEISIEAGDPETAADEVSGIAADLGGSVDSLTVHGGDGDSSAGADLSVRVPADRLDEAFEALEGVGTVLSQSRSAVDVTTEHVDLQARVAALEVSVARLTDLMSGAATTSELLEAEAALSQRQQELDGLRAQLESLEGQVDESTIWVSLRTKQALPGGGPTNFWEGLLAGLDSLSATGTGSLVVLGILLPWLALGGIIAAAVLLIIRSVRRSRRTRAATAATATTAAATSGLSGGGSAHPGSGDARPLAAEHPREEHDDESHDRDDDEPRAQPGSVGDHADDGR